MFFLLLSSKVINQLKMYAYFSSCDYMQPGDRYCKQAIHIHQGSSVFESDEEEEDGERGGAFSAAEKRELMSRFRKLIQALPGRQGQKFDPLLIFPGLESWLSFLKLKLNKEDQVMGRHGICPKFYITKFSG